MKIIGFSSGITAFEGNVDRMVKAVLNKSGYTTNFIKLTDLDFSGCKGCVELCAKSKVCLLKDDIYRFYRQVKEADAVVLGSPVYFNSINSIMISFIERFFGFRHIENELKGKPFVLIISGGVHFERVAREFVQRLRPFEVKIIDIIAYDAYSDESRH